MKKGKRWICVSLLVSMIVGLCGCGAAELEPVHSIEYPYKISDEVVIGIGEPEKERPGEDEIGEEKKPGEGETGEEEKPGLSKEEEEAALAEITHLPVGVNGFAFSMYTQLGADDDIFFSPYSLCAALSMLNLGAGEETKAEIEAVLGIEDFDAWNAEMLTYLERQWTDDTYVTTANAIWMDENEEFAETMEEEFLQPLAAFYKSELHTGDFKGRTAAVIKEINGWVKKNTDGMIPQIINQLPKTTVMVLANAVYFEGKWDNDFKEENTLKATFYGTGGESQIDMMHQYWEEYAYIEYEGMKGVSLPYKGDEVVMKIFIPMEEDEDIIGLFGALTDAEKQQLLDALDTCGKTELKQLAIPKFTMEKSIDNLPVVLKDMGMSSAFDPHSANFDIIAEDLFVSDALHKAKIEVDEEGTKAAAVTVITSDTTAFVEPQNYEFVADRPFVYVLQDTKTGMILFLGRVNNL